MAKKSNKELEEEARLRREILEMDIRAENSASNHLKLTQEQIRIEADRRDLRKEISRLEDRLENIDRGKLKRGVKYRKDLLQQIKDKKNELSVTEKTLKVEKERVSTAKSLANAFRKIPVRDFYNFLMESDKAIKSVSLELGLGAARSEMLRNNINESASYAARLGASITDLSNIISVYADETGRASIHSEEALNSIIQIGKGTGLGVEQASRLAGQFELMGVNAQGTADYVQGVVDTTERMGVNTTKVLKNITTNFKQLQKFTFRDGVKGFAEMASYAEKFKVDMGSMLDSAEKARTLEGAVDLAAQLQVMGGEFAKSDPFELLFLSRNDPAEYTKKVNEMTKGVATFRKNADGTFETFVSPMDIDRLNKVGEALGMQKGELIEQARRMAEIQKARQQMLGAGFTSKEKELVEGAARMNQETGKMMVQIGTMSYDVSKLTKGQVEMLKTQGETLEQRAMAAQTFDEAFKATIAEFKTALLPFLKGINGVLEYIRPAVIKISEMFDKGDNFTKALIIGGGLLLAAGVKLTAALTSGGIKKLAGGIVGGSGGGIGGIGTSATKASGSQMLGRGKMAAGFGKGALGAGAGIGLAAAGVGGGIKLAADGFANLANAMKDMPMKNLEVFKEITISLTKYLPLAALGVVIFGKAATAGALGLIAFGGAVALVGAGIGLATAGIGYMSENLAKLEGVDLAKIAFGLSTIMGVTAAGGVAGILGGSASSGIAKVAESVNMMANAGAGMELVGNAFEKIGVVMNGSTSQLDNIKETINAISSAEIGNSSAIASLSALLSKPLQVEFADKDVGLNANITLNMDGRELVKRLNLQTQTSIQTVDAKQRGQQS